MHRGAGELEPARKLFEQAVAHHPAFEHARIGLARTLIALDKPADALPHLKAALELNPDSSVAYYHAARANRALGDTAAQQVALAQFNRTRTLAAERAAAVPQTKRDVTPQALDPETPDDAGGAGATWPAPRASHTIAAHPAGDVSIVDVATVPSSVVSASVVHADGESHRARAPCSSPRPRRPAVAQVQLSRLDGVVVDAADRPVGGVTVTVSDPLGATIRRATADASGRFLIVDLPPGRYRLAVDGGGAATSPVPLTIADGLSSSVTLRMPPAFRDAVVVEGARPAASIATRTSLGAESIARTPGRAGSRRAAGRRRHAARLGHRGQRPAAQPRRRRRLPLRRRRRARLRAPRSDVGPGAGRVDDRRAHRRDRLRAAGVRLQVRRRDRRTHARGDRARGAGSGRSQRGATPRPTAVDRPAVPSGAARRCGCRRAASDRRASSIRSIPTTSTTKAAA